MPPGDRHDRRRRQVADPEEERVARLGGGALVLGEVEVQGGGAGEPRGGDREPDLRGCREGEVDRVVRGLRHRAVGVGYVDDPVGPELRLAGLEHPGVLEDDVRPEHRRRRCRAAGEGHRDPGDRDRRGRRVHDRQPDDELALLGLARCGWREPEPAQGPGLERFGGEGQGCDGHGGPPRARRDTSPTGALTLDRAWTSASAQATPSERVYLRVDAGEAGVSGWTAVAGRAPSTAGAPRRRLEPSGSVLAEVRLADVVVGEQLLAGARRGRCCRPRGRSPGRPATAPPGRSARPGGSSCPADCSSVMVDMIRCIISGDRPIEGSSSMSSLGRLIMARPMASICCSPPENVPAGWLRRSSEDREEVVGARRRSLAMPALSLRAKAPRIEVLLDASGAGRSAGPRGSGRGRGDDLVGGGAVDPLALEADLPALRLSSPEMVRSVVVLPAPLVPISVTTWPSSTVKVMPLTASILP